jgi:hypothetical protein
MNDNPLGALIQGLLILFVLWSVPSAWYVLLNHRLIRSQYRLIASLHKENAELRRELAYIKQPNEPEWVRWLFSDDQPSDPKIGVVE